MSKEVDFRTYTDTTFVVIVKFGFPLLLLIGLVTVFKGAAPAAVLVEVPLLVWALFNFTAAQVRADDDVLRYRRFFKWADIPYEQIVECKVAIAPAMGVLRLRRFIPPWGRLYFVLEEPSFRMVVPGGQSALTAFINAQRDQKARVSSNPHVSAGPEKAGEGAAACGVAAMAGAMLAVLSRVLFPDFPIRFDPAKYPAWMIAWQDIQERMLQWPWNGLGAIVLLAILVWLRFRTRAWGVALALGAMLGLICAKAVG